MGWESRYRKETEETRIGKTKERSIRGQSLPQKCHCQHGMASTSAAFRHQLQLPGHLDSLNIDRDALTKRFSCTKSRNICLGHIRQMGPH